MHLAVALVSIIDEGGQQIDRRSTEDWDVDLDFATPSGRERNTSNDSAN